MKTLKHLEVTGIQFGDFVKKNGKTYIESADGKMAVVEIPDSPMTSDYTQFMTVEDIEERINREVDSLNDIPAEHWESDDVESRYEKLKSLTWGEADVTIDEYLNGTEFKVESYIADIELSEKN